MYPFNSGPQLILNTNMKRTISDVDDSSDCDDVFADGLGNTSKSSQMPNNNGEPNGTCHMLNRKKRRGMIEKRRRDRINNSLLELRRLVPAAFEKQGSAKLEKAEILQMTVDHLRTLHSKGFDAFSFDPHKFATDYHSIGFRECAAEVARYMVAIEGMDLQDPLRLRLMSHLQCYSAQRELALKSSATHTGWNPSAFTTPPYPALSSLPPTHTSNMSSLTSLSSDSMQLHSSAPVSSHYTPNNSHHFHHQSIDGSNVSITGPQMMNHSGVHKSNGSPPPISSSIPIGYPSSSTTSMSQMGSNAHNPYFTSGYMSSSGIPSTSGLMTQQQRESVKHYRPWGAELAY